MKSTMTRWNNNINLLFLIKIFLIYFIFIFKFFSSYADNENSLIAIGSNDAKVKIKIYSSFTCPHCANFHKQVVPEIKKNYVDTGKVQLIFMDFPLDQAAFNASKILHCIEQNKQIGFLDTIYETQNQWTDGSNINEINVNLKKIVKSLGITSSRFDKCVNNKDIEDKILNARIDGHQKYSINSTPTIIINEKKLEGSVSFKNIKKKIEKLI